MAGRSSQADNRGSNPLGFSVSGKGRQFHTYKDAAYVAPVGHTATGGTITTYTDPGGTQYRAHTFTSSGAFTVTEIGDFGSTIEYFIVAGGGGGSFGGGGGGGIKSNSPFMPSPRRDSAYTIATNGGPASNGAYPVVIGAAGATRNSGSNSVLNNPGNTITANGGGYGGGQSGNSGDGDTGGSGGGGGHGPSPGRAGGGAPDSDQGFAGGDGLQSGDYYGGGGGGGAGGAGGGASTSPGNDQNTGGNGGVGLQATIAGPTNTNVGAPGPSAGRWFGGGGGGAYSGPNEGLGGGPGGPYAGGGNGSSNSSNTVASTGGATNTGGGGGGGNGAGAPGGSGVVIIRYQY